MLVVAATAKRVYEPTLEEKHSAEFLMGFVEGFGGPGTESIEQCEVTSKDISSELKKVA